MISRVVWSWALYDFANSPFNTLVVTFVYATFFTQVVAPNPIYGTTLWSRAVTVTALVVALTSPILGAFADRGGYRKRLLLLFTATTVIGSVALYAVLPGQAVLALCIFVVADISFELAGVMYNAFLPMIAPAERIGRISGFGWGLGYFGGLLALVVALLTLVRPETPWFGFSHAAGENIRATNLLVAIWFAIFSLPLFIWVKQVGRREPPGGDVLKATGRQLAETWKAIRSYRQVLRFLFARLLYNDALVTIFAFGGIYAAGTFGFSVQELLVFGIVLNIAAGVGAFAMAFLDDAMGGKRTVQFSLIGLALATLLAVVAPSKLWFWTAALIVGFFAGPNQSASRSLMARFVPSDKENEFFGFFAFSGKATAFLGPLLLGILTEMFGSQRIGVTIVLVLFVLGLVALARVDEKEGIRAARRSDDIPRQDQTVATEAPNTNA